MSETHHEWTENDRLHASERINIRQCICLMEIENNLPRTKFCFMACDAQLEIIKERQKIEDENKKDKDKNSNI